VRLGSAVIAEERGDVLGFACGVMQGLQIGDLTELYVRPDARRRGIAGELVRAVLAALRERGAVFVTGGVGPDNAPARSFYEKAGYLSSIEDGFIDEVIACFETAPFPSPGSIATPLISAMPMGGAVGRVPEDAMAFPRDNSAYWWDVATMWNDADDDPAYIEWCRAVYERLKPYASQGAYINLMVDDDPAGNWLRTAYGDVAQRTDRNVERHARNNIPPHAPRGERSALKPPLQRRLPPRCRPGP